MIRLFHITLIGLAVICTTPALGAENPYSPMHVGTSWVRNDSATGLIWQGVTKSEVFRGRRVLVFETDYCCGGAQPTFAQMASLSPLGEVLFHGWENLENGLVAVVDPPAVTLPADLMPGAQWTVDFTETWYQDGEFYLENHIARTHHVIGIETITVPAGTFSALKIEVRGLPENPGDSSQPKYGLIPEGEATTRQLGDLQFTVWYAEDVGSIRTEWPTGRFFELTSFTPGVVKTELQSWGSLKSRFE